MIKVSNVSKNFDGFQALNSLNMDIGAGAVYGLVGPNGAGKSTIIRHIVGIYRQDEGDITIEGERVYENPKIKSRIAYIPDDLFYFNSATIRDMMRFYQGIYPRFDYERFNKLRDIFDLDQARPMRRLSKGMQKQAAFWIAISCRPDILVLDEPVDGLDPVMRRQIWGIVMGDVAEYGTTVLVSSHNLRELEDICDHVGIMNNGSILLERSLSELQENIVKIQVALPEGGKLPDNLEIVHESQAGRLHTLIIRGDSAELSARFESVSPLFFDLLPLTLEEIFIYELGGADYAVKDILL